MDWSGSTDTKQVKHHTYAEYQSLMEELVATYPTTASFIPSAIPLRNGSSGA